MNFVFALRRLEKGERFRRAEWPPGKFLAYVRFEPFGDRPGGLHKIDLWEGDKRRDWPAKSWLQHRKDNRDLFAEDWGAIAT